VAAMKLTIHDELLSIDEISKVSKQITDLYATENSRNSETEFFWNPSLDELKKSPMVFLGILLTKAYKSALVRIPHVNSIGCEYWVNINGKQGFHYDCDEVLRTQYGIMSYPLLSSVYYLSYKNVDGGEIELYDITNSRSEVIDLYTGKLDFLRHQQATIHKPCENQFIMFSSKTPHRVRKWQRGERISVAINFWEKRPLQKDHDFGEALVKISEMQH